MKKTLSIILAALMLISAIPLFASAATISLSRSNVVVIPPTASVSEISYGAGLADITVSGGTLWYVDEEENRTEVKGYFDIRNKTTLNPTTTGEYNLPLVFYPEDTATYGEVSGALNYITMKKKIVSGEWPSVYIRGAYTEIVTPPAFTCDAGDSLVYYTNYTKTGGKVVDANGTNITSSGQFYIDDASTGGKNQYLYNDTYVTARWDGKSGSGYEKAYYENVLVKVTRKTATLTTAPSVPGVLIGTTYGDALSQLTATVTLVGTKTSYDTSYKYWIPTYPEGVTAETPLTEDTTLTLNYQNPATDDTFSAEVSLNVYTKPLAEITERPTVDASVLKPGMKASAITFTGGKAVKEGTETEVSGKFSVKDPDALLSAGYNTVEVVFTPDDTESYEGTSINMNINVASLITTAPTLDATGVEAGMTASALTLSGGEATEEGTFSIVDPDQVLTVGTNKIKVKFTPSAEGAQYYETKVINVVVKTEFKFLDKDGNETVPVYTITYGTALSDSNTNIPMILAQTGCSLNATSKFSYRGPEGQDYIISGAFGGTVFPVGEHTFKVRVMNSGYTIYDDPPYINTELQFIIKVEPVEMNVMGVHYNTVSNEITVRIDNVGAKGTLDVYIDGVLVGDDVETKKYGMDDFRTAEITGWTPTETTFNKDYNVKVVYNPIENDPVSMADYESTFRTRLTLPIINENNISSLPDAAVDGSRIKCQILSYEHNGDFIQWYITDLEGNELDLEIFGIEEVRLGNDSFTTEIEVDAEITDTTIYFYMPNHPIKVSYKTQAMLDAEAKQEAIDNCDCLCHYTNPVAEFIWKVISFFMDLFGIDKPCDCGYPHEVK